MPEPVQRRYLASGGDISKQEKRAARRYPVLTRGYAPALGRTSAYPNHKWLGRGECDRMQRTLVFDKYPSACGDGGRAPHQAAALEGVDAEA